MLSPLLFASATLMLYLCGRWPFVSSAGATLLWMCTWYALAWHHTHAPFFLLCLFLLPQRPLYGGRVPPLLFPTIALLCFSPSLPWQFHAVQPHHQLIVHADGSALFDKKPLVGLLALQESITQLPQGATLRLKIASNHPSSVALQLLAACQKRHLHVQCEAY